MDIMARESALEKLGQIGADSSSRAGDCCPMYFGKPGHWAVPVTPEVE